MRARHAVAALDDCKGMPADLLRRTRCAMTASGWCWAALVALVLLMPPAMASGEVDLVVRLEGLKDEGGSVHVGLFDSAEGFALREGGVIASQIAKVDGGVVVVRFKGLPPGRYGVTAYHDANDNGRFDRLLGLLPAEGVALSNNPSLFPPPGFDDLAIELDGPAEVLLRFIYLSD